MQYNPVKTTAETLLMIMLAEVPAGLPMAMHPSRQIANLIEKQGSVWLRDCLPTNNLYPTVEPFNQPMKIIEQRGLLYREMNVWKTIPALRIEARNGHDRIHESQVRELQTLGKQIRYSRKNHRL